MTVPINYWALLVCVVINMVLGMLWYGPFFGKPWMKMSGISQEKMAKTPDMAKKVTISMILAAITSFIMAFVLAHSIAFASSYMQISGLNAGLQGAFWNWLGFVMPVTLSIVLWEMKPWKLWFINASYYLVALCLMGTVISLWQ